MSVYDKWDEQNSDDEQMCKVEREPTGMMPVHGVKGAFVYHPPNKQDEPMPMTHEDFDVFVTKNYKKLLNMVRAIKGLQRVDAEDILQDALERLSKRPEKIDASKNPEHWIKRAVIHKSRDFFREQKKRIEVEGTSLNDIISDENFRERNADEADDGSHVMASREYQIDALVVLEHSTLEREVVEELFKLDQYYDDEGYTAPYVKWLQGWTVVELEEEFDLSTKAVRYRLDLITTHLRNRFKDYRV